LHGIDSEIDKNIFDELNKYMPTNTIYVFHHIIGIYFCR
jgi:hypothetical protein